MIQLPKKRKEFSRKYGKINDTKLDISQHDSKIRKSEKEKEDIQREIVQLHASSNSPDTAEFEKLQSK
jgi:cell division protein FtsL